MTIAAEMTSPISQFSQAMKEKMVVAKKTLPIVAKIDEDSSKTDPQFLMYDEEQDGGRFQHWCVLVAAFSVERRRCQQPRQLVPAPAVAGSSNGACWLQHPATPVTAPEPLQNPAVV